MSRKSKFKRDSKKKKARKSSNYNIIIDRKLSSKTPSGPVMTMINNPLSDITYEQRKELLSELHANGEDKVIEIFEYLNIILRKYNPIGLISILSSYGLTNHVGDGDAKSIKSTVRLEQAHIELLQALVLQIPESELGSQPIPSNIVQEVIDKLIEITYAFNYSRMRAELLDVSENNMAINRIQESIRSHTQIVRNWGFHSQVINISKEIYGHFDQVILEKNGFSASDAIETFEAMIKIVEEKLSLRKNALYELKHTKSNYDLLLKYHELIGQGKSEADRFANKIDIKTMSHLQLFSILLSHFDLRLIDNYFFKSEDITILAKIEKNKIDKILEYFSFSFGDLHNKNREYFFLDNPIWKKPIISSRIGYFCPIPQLFFSFILSTLDDIVEKDSKNVLSKRRSDYLELKIEEIVKRRFPESQTISGVKWDLNGNQYETDMITFIDSHAIIIEAKSHKISKPALRGAKDRIKKHLEEIFIEPSIQSYRLEQKINSIISQESSTDPLIKQLPVDIHSIKKVLRVSVTLEDFATLQTNLRLFDQAGWLPEDFVPCPTMNLADFETLFDLLEHPVQIIHYLSRRTELEGVIKFNGDELDFMGLYLMTLLNIGNMETGDQNEIILSGMSQSLDKYYTAKDQGLIIEKPQPKICQMFKKIFDKLEERATPRWTELGCILNRFPPDMQFKLTKSIEKLATNVNKKWQIEGHINSLILVPPDTSEYSLTIVLFKNANKHRRNEFIESATINGLEPIHVKFCLVIAINIDKKMPYDFIALCSK